METVDLANIGMVTSYAALKLTEEKDSADITKS